MKARHSQPVKEALFDLKERIGHDVYVKTSRTTCKGGWLEDYVGVWLANPDGKDRRLSYTNARNERDGDWTHPEGLIGALYEANEKVTQVANDVAQDAVFAALTAPVEDEKQEEDA